VLHTFTGGNDGAGPDALKFGGDGALYGTTAGGGADRNGVVFRLSSAAGRWDEKVIYSFTSADDVFSSVGIVFNSAGNLYGAALGGNLPGGVVYRLTPGKNRWTFAIIYNFMGTTDGHWPQALLTFDDAGNLYSTTIGGGTGNCTNGCGTVFTLRP